MTVEHKIMTIGLYRRGIGVFSTEKDVELALSALKDAGFPMDKVSVIARDDNGEPAQGTDINKKPGHELGKGAEIGSVTGTVFGLLSGLLLSASTLAIPGFGTIVVAGTLLETVATTLAGAGVGAASGGILGALSGLGIPGDRAKVYTDYLTHGHYLVMVEGKSDEVMRAEMLLVNERGIEEWAVYDAHSDRPAGSSESATN